MKYEDLTNRIIGASFTVMNELGDGFLESVYENALIHELRQQGLDVEQQKQLHIKYKGKAVGNFTADLIVENSVLVELKAAKDLSPAHKAQTINYLKATGISVGLLINFGKPKIEFKRFTRSTN